MPNLGDAVEPSAPSATQVIQLWSKSTVPMEVEPVSRAVRLDVLVHGVPSQLENDETFVLPSAACCLNVEMSSDATFPRVQGATRHKGHRHRNVCPCRVFTLGSARPGRTQGNLMTVKISSKKPDMNFVRKSVAWCTD